MNIPFDTTSEWSSFLKDVLSLSPRNELKIQIYSLVLTYLIDIVALGWNWDWENLVTKGDNEWTDEVVQRRRRKAAKVAVTKGFDLICLSLSVSLCLAHYLFPDEKN